MTPRPAGVPDPASRGLRDRGTSRGGPIGTDFFKVSPISVIGVIRGSIKQELNMQPRILGAIFCACLFSLIVFLAACSSPSLATAPPAVLRLATTTSTQDSGLLDSILPVFESKFNVRVDVVAV